MKQQYKDLHGKYARYTGNSALSRMSDPPYTLDALSDVLAKLKQDIADFKKVLAADSGKSGSSCLIF